MTQEKEALYWRVLKGDALQCTLCPHWCTILEGKRGKCRVRENRHGRLYSLVYGKPSAIQIDPIEKKPNFHFLPGTWSYSIGTVGCNLRCAFCQNWQLSQASPGDLPHYDLPPKAVVEEALRYGCASISYTYNDPVVFIEYVMDTARLARPRGLKNVFVTAGFINPQPLDELCGLIDSAHVDLKGFSEQFYKEVSGARLEPVLATLKTLKRKGVWFEVIHLTVPGLSDDPDEIRMMCEWMRENLGTEVPLHFTQFHPEYKMLTTPVTPVATLERAHAIAKDVGLEYVYVGNVPGHPLENTYCPRCGKMLIERWGFEILKNLIPEGICPYCGKKLAGVWR
ncbi:MAG: AmmeMemoRadiSam system radical SAM enzyme [Candidatus Micrarchaeia archaeon]